MPDADARGAAVSGRASEDYYEAWAEAASDWATRSELIDAWLVNHPEAVVGAWMCA